MLYFAVRTVADISIDIPNRAAFKASEVCEIAQIPSYVLRSWEKEFPGLGAAGRPGGPRIYRREDVEQILRIKQLVFAEGLTLAGARRKIEGDSPIEDVLVLPPAGVPETVRTGVAEARQGLKSLLDLLSAPPAGKSHAEAGGAIEDAPTWPPQKARRASSGAGRPEDEHQGALPLLETPEQPAPKPRRRVTPPRK